MPGDKLRELTERLGGEHRRSFMQSLRDAADGLRIALTERNMRIHVCFMLLVTVLVFSKTGIGGPILEAGPSGNRLT